MGWFLRITVKRLALSRCLDEHVKDPYKYLWCREPDLRFNIFLSLPAHLCAVTVITEISLHVTLSNQSTHSSHSYCLHKGWVTQPMSLMLILPFLCYSFEITISPYPKEIANLNILLQNTLRTVHSVRHMYIYVKVFVWYQSLTIALSDYWPSATCRPRWHRLREVWEEFLQWTWRNHIFRTQQSGRITTKTRY